jgi:alkyl hydroperoxide reductase subunit AhpF
VFGTNFVYGNPATSLAHDRDLLVVGLEDGSEAQARTVVIASGVSYRRLGIPDLEVLVGAGYPKRSGATNGDSYSPDRMPVRTGPCSGLLSC